MRLCVIGPVYPYRGGIAHFTTLLAKKFREAGHEVRVISFKKQYPAWLYPGASDKDHSPGRAQVDADYLLTPLNPFSWRKTVTAIVGFQPQQVILPWWVTFWGPAFGYLLKRLKRQGIPASILIHNTLPHEAGPLDRFLAKRVLKQADRFIVMTEKEKARLLALLPGAREIDIAPLPIYHAFKPTLLSRESLRQQMDLPANQPVILYFGIVRPYKGLGVLIDAMRVIVERGLDAHLLIVGEFWEDQAPYMDQIQNLGLNSRVHIYNRYIPDDEVAGFFKVADLFVAPYIGGTQSAALKTALGFGLPAVATDIIDDAFLHIIPDRCAIVPTNSPTALAEEIAKQFNLAIQDTDQIKLLVDRSWEKMLAVIEHNKVKKSQT